MSNIVHTPDHQAKIKAWRQQHSALSAPLYRITLVGRLGRAEGRSINLGKPRDKGAPEHFHGAAEVEELIPQLRRRNVLGFDVYVTPIDRVNHYIVIDDMRPGATQMLANLGYAPCLVQSSSKGNEQAVLKVPRLDRVDEQTLANNVVRQLNVAYGDPRFSGVIHPFRTAGFSNKKPGRADAFTVILWGRDRICGRTRDALQMLRDSAAPSAGQLARFARSAVAAQKGQQKGNVPSAYPCAAGEERAFTVEIAAVRAWVKRRGLSEDASRVDYRAAIAMLAAGWPAEAVRAGMLSGSEGLAARHSNPTDYVFRTVRKAGLELAASHSFFPRRRRGGCVPLSSDGVRDV